MKPPPGSLWDRTDSTGRSECNPRKSTAAPGRLGDPNPGTVTAAADACTILPDRTQLPDALGIFAGLLSILPLMAAQRKINELHAALGYDARKGSRFSGGDVAVLVIGGLFWLLILFGSSQG